jgi:exportin-7
LLTLLANKGPKLETFAVQQVVSLLCRITKFAWFDEGAPSADGAAAPPSDIRSIVKETRQFLQATIPHCLIGLRILNDLVTEMNYKSKNRTATQQRKVSVSFRDVALLDVFEVALSMINQLATRAISFDTVPPEQHHRVHETLLENTCVRSGLGERERRARALRRTAPHRTAPHRTHC